MSQNSMAYEKDYHVSLWQQEKTGKAAFNGSYKFVYPGALTANVQRKLLLAEYETATTFENGKWYTVISWEI